MQQKKRLGLFYQSLNKVIKAIGQTGEENKQKNPKNTELIFWWIETTLKLLITIIFNIFMAELIYI